ncbi:MAG: dihydropteroate synthase [Prevotellaceae bacterium]|jgi:dihydropteroate synthase|nr:dihydropteroate synthase [Prevotellaceae bacterium]
MKIFRKKRTINCGGKLLDLSAPAIMGILNVTPDSFYANSRISGEREIIARAETIVSEGGVIIDIGGYSSRPDAADIDENEEYSRIRPAMALVRKYFPDAFISVDTFRSSVVKWLCEEFGSFIINDISAGNIDRQMIPYAGTAGLPYIAMHMRGTPKTMQNAENCAYSDIVTEIVSYFVRKKEELINAGVMDIIIDPGFGFSKTLEGNYELLAGLDSFKILELPVLAGVSRKSMFCKLLNITPEESLSATIAGNVLALRNGADILRVHDVKAASDAVKVFAEVNKYSV